MSSRRKFGCLFSELKRQRAALTKTQLEVSSSANTKNRNIAFARLQTIIELKLTVELEVGRYFLSKIFKYRTSKNFKEIDLPMWVTLRCFIDGNELFIVLSSNGHKIL